MMIEPEPTEPPTSCCPVCNAPVDPTWKICTKCAANAKRNSPNGHFALWYVILPVFVIAQLVVAITGTGTVFSIGLIVGLPLTYMAYIVGNAVLDLLRVTPQAGRNGHNATIRFLSIAFVAVVVVPITLVVAVIVFAFGLCAINQ